MKCQYSRIGETSNRPYRYRCQRCGDTRESRYGIPNITRECNSEFVILKSVQKCGETLHNLLYNRFGVDMTLNCACKAWIARMNEGGPEWCRENVQKIVSKMLSEAKRRKWVLEGRPLLSKLARLGTITPWGMAFAREWARKLVLEAIELSEREASDEEAG